MIMFVLGLFLLGAVLFVYASKLAQANTQNLKEAYANWNKVDTTKLDAME